MACAKPFDLPLIPESEWADRLAAQKAAKAQLSDVRNRGMNGKPIPSRDQNGKGYCWAHSSTSAALIVRAVEGQPYADLSAFAVACIIKHFKDQGGWGSESLEFISERGIPTSEFWPQKSTARANDNEKTWANAKLHRVTEWMDMESRNKAQLVTCLLSGIPVVSDFNWWGHSVCTIDLVSLNPFRTRIWNSWGDGWSENGAQSVIVDELASDAGLVVGDAPVYAYEGAPYDLIRITITPSDLAKAVTVAVNLKAED
jgi:hypothetical protein